MRTQVLSFVAVTLVATAPAVAQSVSHQHSNIKGMNIHSNIAPPLPQVGLGPNATPSEYLQAAQRALTNRQTGLAQQALESAETRLLSRTVPQSEAGAPYQGPAVQNISAARQALGQHDIQRALSLVQEAIPMAQQAEAGWQTRASVAAGQTPRP